MKRNWLLIVLFALATVPVLPGCRIDADDDDDDTEVKIDTAGSEKEISIDRD